MAAPRIHRRLLPFPLPPPEKTPTTPHIFCQSLFFRKRLHIAHTFSLWPTNIVPSIATYFPSTAHLTPIPFLVYTFGFPESPRPRPPLLYAAHPAPVLPSLARRLQTDRHQRRHHSGMQSKQLFILPRDSRFYVLCGAGFGSPREVVDSSKRLCDSSVQGRRRGG